MKPQRIHRDTIILLRIGIYLLLFSEAFPDYAVVNEIVKLVPQRARGFVNGMLRNITRSRQGVCKSIRSIKDLRIKHSITDILIRNLEKISLHPEKDLEYLDTEPVFHLRVNTSTSNSKDIRYKLDEEKVSYEFLEPFQSFELKQTAPVIREIILKGHGYFQNTAAQIVSIIASGFSRKSVLDCCTAPGTKAITIKQLKPSLRILAADINLPRMQLFKRSMPTLNHRDFHLLVTDMTAPGLKNRFDLILVDAPCTSAGTLRKNPDLKMKIDKVLIKKNGAIQRDIMDSVITRFPGTTILYSVCSFIKEETDDVIGEMRSIKEMEFIDISPLLEEFGFHYKKDSFGVYLLPSPELNNDIFYLSLFKI